MEWLALQGEDERDHFNGHHIQYCCVNNNPKDCVETTTTNNTNAAIANLIKVSPKSFLSTLQTEANSSPVKIINTLKNVN